MRVGINLLYLLPGVVGGTETYAAGLLDGLEKVGKEHEFVVFVNEESANWQIPQTANFVRVKCQVKADSRSRRYFFEQVALPRLLKRYAIDMIHSLGHVSPLLTTCPAIVTLPDLNYIAIGHTMPHAKRWLLKFFSVQSVKRAKAVITISNYSKSQICNEIKINPNKIIITHLGPIRNDCKKSNNEVDKIKAIYCISDSYFVAFGGGAFHKNIPRLLQAFTKLRKSISCQLVLIGHLPPNVSHGELPEGVIATGYVPTEHVLPLLNGAEVFVLPTLYEGFGLPVIEAQQAGVPVVCSTAGSLPEVAGEAAVFFDPYSVEDMAEKIIRVAGDKALQQTLRQKGLINVKRFSWERTAFETIAVYKQVYEKRSKR